MPPDQLDVWYAGDNNELTPEPDVVVPYHNMWWPRPTRQDIAVQTIGVEICDQQHASTNTGDALLNVSIADAGVNTEIVIDP